MIVFITGASAGFGAEMARTFVKQRPPGRAGGAPQGTPRRARPELGESALPVEMDVTDKASIEEALAMLPQSWRQIDVLINNAGLALNTKPGARGAAGRLGNHDRHQRKGLVTMTRACCRRWSSAAAAW
jgi:3-hydroxy acid dehydrogenase/malonic semialdehyde reductase